MKTGGLSKLELLRLLSIRLSDRHTAANNIFKWEVVSKCQHTH